MKAMILAAGLGSRMRPLTNTTPKPLLLVKGQPLIVHTINTLARGGIKKIVINVHHHAQQIMDYLADGDQYGVELAYSMEHELLDTGGGIKQALPLLGDQPFLVISADVYTDFTIAKLITVPLKLGHLVMVNNPEYHARGDYALVDGKLSLTAEPKLTYANIGLLHPALFATELASPKKFPLNILFKAAINKGEISGEHYTGAWYNIGTPELLAEVNQQ